MHPPRLSLVFFALASCGSLLSRADILERWATNQIILPSFVAGISDVAFGAGRFVASFTYSDSCGIYSSEDGLIWTLRGSDPDGWSMHLSYTGSRFVGVSPVGVTTYSTNGVDWTFKLTGPFGDEDHAGDLTYGRSIFVRVGQTNAAGFILTSPDTQTWTYRAISPAPGGYIASVVFGATPGRFVAVGNNDGLAYTSTSGTGTWTRQAIPGGSRVYCCNGLFIVPWVAGTNLLSKDGLNWDAAYTRLTNQMGGVVFGNGIYLTRSVASGRTNNYLATSLDGTNWVQYAAPFPALNSYSDSRDRLNFATDGSRIVLAGYPQVPNPSQGLGLIFASDPLVALRDGGLHDQKLVLSGLIGRQYQILSATELNTPAAGWQTNSSFQLTNFNFQFDRSGFADPKRFFRAQLLP